MSGHFKQFWILTFCDIEVARHMNEYTDADFLLSYDCSRMRFNALFCEFCLFVGSDVTECADICVNPS